MSHPFEHLNESDFVLEALPDDVLATMEQRNRWLSSVPYDSGGLEYLVADTQGWAPGQTVRVAFLGGTTSLHKKIADIAIQVNEVCNILLDFGFNPATGKYRTWSTSDAEHAAEIRVSFDQGGYFSLVGTDSINEQIGAPGQAVGGRSNQRSLNLGGFDASWPNGGKGTVLHEFLHALAFHHEHQNTLGPCETSFRWEDDTGYLATKDNRGAFLKDLAGRRPGIYSYLSGYPNFWPKTKIDHNLRTFANSAALVPGPFDRSSVMLYRFPTLFYRTEPSPCAPSGDGQSLSNEDVKGLKLLYPASPQESAALVVRKEKMLEALFPTKTNDGLESATEEPPPFATAVAKVLRANLRKSLDN